MFKIRFHLPAALTFILPVLLLTAACHKKEVAQEDIGYATDHANSEQTFNDVQLIADQASAVSSGSMAYRTTSTTGSGCATVTRSTGRITIDFGPSNCLCHDGRWRRGQIIVAYTGNYADSGSVHTITFDNYYVNKNKVTGTKTVTNMGHNAAGQPYFKVEVNGAVTLSGGGTISASWTRTRTWIQGYDTPSDFSDDVYQVTGSGQITRTSGELVNVAITAPLTIATACHWIESGSVTYTLPGGSSRVLDYGDTPQCDDMATVVLPNGITRSITLP